MMHASGRKEATLQASWGHEACSCEGRGRAEHCIKGRGGGYKGYIGYEGWDRCILVIIPPSVGEIRPAAFHLASLFEGNKLMRGKFPEHGQSPSAGRAHHGSRGQPPPLSLLHNTPG